MLSIRRKGILLTHNVMEGHITLYEDEKQLRPARPATE